MNQQDNHNGVHLGDSHIGKKKRRRDASDLHSSPVAQWLIKHSGGFINNKRQATYVSLGFAAIVIIISLIVVFSGTSQPDVEPGINPATGEEIPGEM